MKVMLTSFGIGSEPEKRAKDAKPSFLRMFRNMPPVNMQIESNSFIPDYAVLLLCDKVIMDKNTFRQLNESVPAPYSFVAEIFKSLYDEGFVELADYYEILKNNNTTLQTMISKDLENINSWIYPLRESNKIWTNFCRHWLLRQDKVKELNTLPNAIQNEMFSGNIMDCDHMVVRYKPNIRNLAKHMSNYKFIHEITHFESKKNSKQETPQERVLKIYLLDNYLHYVNSNILVSKELNVGFHDWMDFQPFYRCKFLSLGGTPNEERKTEQLRKLFEIQFPEFTITDSMPLIDILKDKRIENLRKLVQQASEGTVKFDKDFAIETRKAVANIPKRTKRYCKITSWLTMPLTLLPYGSFVKKGIEEVVEKVTEYKLQQPYRWFYLLNDY